MQEGPTAEAVERPTHRGRVASTLDDLLADAVRTGHELQVPKHRFVFRRGDIPAGLYVVASGHIKLAIPSPGGSEKVLAYCAANSIGFIPWFPLAAGELTEPGGSIDRIAKAHRATAGQVALAWLLQRSPVMLPIPGTVHVAHLEENVAATDVSLTRDEIAELDAAA